MDEAVYNNNGERQYSTISYTNITDGVIMTEGSIRLEGGRSHTKGSHRPATFKSYSKESKGMELELELGMQSRMQSRIESRQER